MVFIGLIQSRRQQFRHPSSSSFFSTGNCHLNDSPSSSTSTIPLSSSIDNTNGNGNGQSSVNNGNGNGHVRSPPPPVPPKPPRQYLQMDREDEEAIYWTPMMSRQPVRVPQPPITITPSASVAASTAMTTSTSSTGNRVNGQQQLTYNELLDLAEQQRRQIEANRREIEEKESRLRGGTMGKSSDGGFGTAARLRNLKHQVAVEEAELSRLSNMQREAEGRQREAAAARMELARLQHIFSAKEIELRAAASKVETLRTQLDEIHRRRESAATMAFARQQQLKKMQSSSTSSASSTTGTNEVDSSRTSSSNVPVENNRPRAAVEPFQVSVQIVRPSNLAITGGDKKPLSSDSSPDQQQQQQQRLPTEITRPTQAPPPIPPPPPPPPPLIPLNHSKTTSTARESPSPPGDPAPSSMISMNVNGPVIHRPQQSINARLKTYNLIEEAKALASEAPPADLLGSDRYDQVEADKLALRNDTLRAAKRRSWAQQDSHLQHDHDETENIKRVLIQEQLKGKSHINFSDIFNNHEPTIIISPTPTAPAITAISVIDEYTNKHKKETTMTPETITISETKIIGLSPYERSDSIAGEMEEIKEKKKPQEPPLVTKIEQLPMKKEDEEQIENEQKDEPIIREIEEFGEFEVDEVDEATRSLIKPNPDKGILKCKPSSGYRKEKRNIEFDPLALLLDAALEGELDLVVASAAKMPDVSRSNDEGITALHNAICAGHYEIVRFLVEKHADVNAQDSDGWTPLHCAASCNNLPVVKFLVERGGCVFATTLSDQETPADKCEEEEEGYDGCIQYMLAVKNAMGRLADRIIYTAYPFDGENDDELSFEEGVALRVDDRDGEESLWWLCTDMETGQSGYVPRNYLALYPRLKHAHRFNMPTIDLRTSPTTTIELSPTEANNNTVKVMENDDVTMVEQEKKGS